MQGFVRKSRKALLCDCNRIWDYTGVSHNVKPLETYIHAEGESGVRKNEQEMGVV